MSDDELETMKSLVAKLLPALVPSLLEQLLPKIRGHIWAAALVAAALVGLTVYLITRTDIENLKSDIRTGVITQSQNVSVDRGLNTEHEAIRQIAADKRSERTKQGKPNE